MTEKKVLVYGSLNLDHVYSVDHFAGPGETIPARDMKVSCGGKGLNQAVAFAKAGAQTYLAGKTGSGGDLRISLRRSCGAGQKSRLCGQPHRLQPSRCQGGGLQRRSRICGKY